MSGGNGRDLNSYLSTSVEITHIKVDHWDRTPAVRMPPRLISIREGCADKEASIVKVCSGANTDKEPRHIIRAHKVGRLIGGTLRVFCTTKSPYCG